MIPHSTVRYKQGGGCQSQKFNHLQRGFNKTGGGGGCQTSKLI